MIEFTGFRWVPDYIQGYVKDLPLRWACEEAGLAYKMRLLDFADLHTDDYRRLQPFEQVPIMVDGDVQVFETGSILLCLAEKAPWVLLGGGMNRTRTWVFAALTSVEPYIAAYFNSPKTAADDLKTMLSRLNKYMNGRQYLENTFSVGDIMMSFVLRNLLESGLLTEFPELHAYHQRCESRPAFHRAYAAHMDSFEAPKK